MEYKSRIIDCELQEALESFGAVLITGPKACGKTESARRVALSEIRVDTEPAVPMIMQTDPELLLRGKTPRLIDEWQEQQQIWNYVRHAVDDRQKTAQFILAGSANPAEDVKLHSGAGRIYRLRMRPMTWWESGWSSGEVSLAGLLNGEVPKSAVVDISLEQIAQRISIGGWPALIGKNLRTASRYNRDYVSLIAEVDISRVSERKRDPLRVRRLLESYARNTAIPTTISTLAIGAMYEDNQLARTTVMDYVDALTRLMIVDDLPAWNAHLRSRAALRTTPKRHFVDPSLAVAVLNANVESLLQDIVFLGFLFESEVLRDLRVFGQEQQATLAHYKDSKKRETDIIMQFPGGTWAAFEVKLGFNAADAGAASLLRVKHEIDTEKQGNCLALTVITGFGFAHQRPDGVNVVPLATLRP
jgi:predicted AAA+ superfamily ATPase